MKSSKNNKEKQVFLKSKDSNEALIWLLNQSRGTQVKSKQNRSWQMKCVVCLTLSANTKQKTFSDPE